MRLLDGTPLLITIFARVSRLSLGGGRVITKLISTVMSVLDSKIESHMKGEICGEFSIQ